MRVCTCICMYVVGSVRERVRVSVFNHIYTGT